MRRASSGAKNLPSIIDIAAGFTTVRANAQPGACGCFYQYGGSAEIAANTLSGLGLLCNFGETTASNINGGGHDLRLTTYLAGARYSFYTKRRFTPFGQVLVGAVHGSTNFAVDRDTSTLAFASGSGQDYEVAPRIALRLVQAEYLLTHVANGGNNEQDQLRLTAGVVFHVIRSRKATP